MQNTKQVFLSPRAGSPSSALASAEQYCFASTGSFAIQDGDYLEMPRAVNALPRVTANVSHLTPGVDARGLLSDFHKNVTAAISKLKPDSHGAIFLSS